VQNYYLTVHRAAAREDAYLTDLNAIIEDQNILQPAFDPNIFTYDLADVPYATASVTLAATPDEGATLNPAQLGVKNLAVGQNSFPITVTAENGSTRAYTIIVNRGTPTSTDKITSDTFGHTMDDTYVYDIAQYTTAATLKTEFDNPLADLELWDAADTSQLSDTTPAATGQILKLIIAGIEKDRKIIIVKGDLNGDGAINGIDFTRILNHTADIIYIHPQP
jgi:hypothetical protein